MKKVIAEYSDHLARQDQWRRDRLRIEFPDGVPAEKKQRQRRA